MINITEKIVQEDINQAINIIREKSNNPDISFAYITYSDVFSFSNENMVGYYDKLNLKDKKVLTVCGSGDQALNAILYGAQSVHTFDINRLTQYALDLKRATILSLTYNEFMRFWPADWNWGTHLEKSVYDSIKHHLFITSLDDENNIIHKDNSGLFWNTLFNNFNKYELMCLFRGIIDWSYNWLSDIIPYFNEDSYSKLRAKLIFQHPTFIESCLTKLPYNLENNTYDIILLSNIYSTLVSYSNAEELEKFKNLILRLSKNLNQNGQIAYAYMKNFKTHSAYLSKKSEVTIVNMFDQEERDIIYINEGDQEKDPAILIYKKAA